MDWKRRLNDWSLKGTATAPTGRPNKDKVEKGEKVFEKLAPWVVLEGEPGGPQQKGPTNRNAIMASITIPKDDMGGRYQSLIPLLKRKEIESNEYPHKLNNYELDAMASVANSHGKKKTPMVARPKEQVTD